MNDLIIKYRKKLLGDNLKTALTRIAVLILMVLFYYFCGCPIRWLTGLCCPGCGMTRAILACLRLDFAAAWNYHPVVFIMPIVAILLIIFRKNKRAVSIICLCTAVILIAVYIVRMAQGGDVVYFHPHDSVIFKLINLLK